jgi:hypothetical protein
MSCPLNLTLRSVLSTLRATGGREIPFFRAILSIKNTGSTAVAGIVPHATFSEERGLVHDATEALKRSAAADRIQPGGELQWDVYDALLAAHAGVASRVHLWGYKAVLNWTLDLSAWSDYRSDESAAPSQTPVSRWKIRWSPVDPSTERIELIVE